ncbi:MAG: ATP-dependent Clp protease ATP-binding subunit ClpC [Patescibacteria group bacterium]|nr:ATP-dependent Clp protease ATP-binding subunit ClpC [Patescibacteria group bacterium]
MNPSLHFNLQSPRATKARFGKIFDSQPVRLITWLGVLLSLFFWFWGVFIEHQLVAHLLFALSGTLAMPLFWYYGELKELPPVSSIDSVSDVSDVLSRRLLAKARANMSPQEIAKMISNEQGAYFYRARFAIGPEFLQNLSSQDTAQSAVVWQNALAVARSTKSDRIDSAVLAAGLVMTIPQYEHHLAQLQLDSDDVLGGVSWRHHMRMMRDRQRQKRHYGGIGRDLSFGWAPVLNHVGFNITNGLQSGGILRRPVDSRVQTIDQIIHLLAQPGRRNAVLVGEVGVGKTTLVYTMAQRLLQEPKNVPANLRYQQVIELNASHLIANAKGKGELEELLMHIFNEAIHAKNVVLFLDEAQLFLREGTGSVDLSSVLMPVLEGGALKIILALDNQEWLRIAQTSPGFTQSLNRVVVNPLDEAETIQVIEDQTLIIEGKHGVVLMNQAIKEAYKLAERYIHEQAFPGKALKLLDVACGFPEQQHFVTARSVQQGVEKSFDIKVQTADTFEEKDTLLNLEAKIHQRMINQTRAVKLVSDALRRARTGVGNEKKPIGTFLFLGPTGVGKTELSKALADVYFGGQDRIVRIDLNEFSHPDDTNRLLATGATDPYSLCAQIAKQPFSVVLFDEIEKAHPNVLNLLLQLLDEGMLRDSQNKPISFRDSIVIATSNAGAENIRARIDQGQQLEQFEDELVNELINANVFRPEFINRFDEIILFRPLTKPELMQVVDLLMSSINKTLASRKISVSLTDAAKGLLVDKGYDPRLGARPLRRVVQRSVENVVAQRLLAGTANPGQVLLLDAPELLATLDERG